MKFTIELEDSDGRILRSYRSLPARMVGATIEGTIEETYTNRLLKMGVVLTLYAENRQPIFSAQKMVLGRLWVYTWMVALEGK